MHSLEEEGIARDVAAVARVSSVPTILRILCEATGMGFAAVARVSDNTWTACAVQDNISFGLGAGDQLPLATTLCVESRAARAPIVIHDVTCSDQYRDHHTPRLYGFRSYVSVPIVLPNGEYFGNLCAIDPQPARVDEPQILTLFNAYAELIGKQLDQEGLRDRADQALTQERAQSALLEQYVAVLGHDLRNPLGAITACAQLLIRRNTGLATIGTGRRILASAGRMARLIDDVLDFTRVRLGGGMQLKPALAPQLAAALQEVANELSVQYPEQPLSVDLLIGTPVWCDQPRIQQLLSNLLANAFVHGAKDQPVRVQARIEDGELLIRVANAGRPIAPEHLPRIFEPYYRPPTSREGGGLGLGLHICAQIAAAHGGQLQVSSSEAEGTTFTARLPAAQGPAAAGS